MERRPVGEFGHSILDNEPPNEEKHVHSLFTLQPSGGLDFSIAAFRSTPKTV